MAATGEGSEGEMNFMKIRRRETHLLSFCRRAEMPWGKHDILLKGRARVKGTDLVLHCG